ncbi:arabinose efflux permease family protein [Corynebacterium singulare]|uniref:Arabinose efflux permease family protein n=2 Tax=Corynebacterium singulare TaxID=161899 RepID=A0A0B6ESS1_9CORY|nr:MFS transporter [Corynebacterium singulare]AJI77838.1 arabinose efflux permease family protein [Corynebacterium singulare]
MHPPRNGGGEGFLSIYALTATYFLLSACGSMTSLSISLHFAELNKGELLVASIFISGICAQVFAVPLLTPLFNKFNSYQIAFAALFLDLLGLLSMAAYPEPLVLILGNLFTACLSGLSIPSIFVIADSQVSEGQQAKAFSLLDTARLGGGFLGPPLGGLLLDQRNLQTALFVEACAVGLSLMAFYSFYKSPPEKALLHPETQESSPSFLQKVLEAPSLLLKDRSARSALTSIWGAIICTSIFNVSLVFYAIKTLHVSGTLYAIIAQAFIVGRIFGARLSARLHSQNAEKVLTGAGFAMGCFIALPGLFPSLWLCIPCFLLGGVCNAAQVAALRIVVVGSVRDEVKPKALSTMGSINSSAMLIGYIIGAPVVSAIGPAAALVVSGLGTSILTAGPTLKATVHGTFKNQENDPQ